MEEKTKTTKTDIFWQFSKLIKATEKLVRANKLQTMTQDWARERTTGRENNKDKELKKIEGLNTHTR